MIQYRNARVLVDGDWRTSSVEVMDNRIVSFGDRNANAGTMIDCNNLLLVPALLDLQLYGAGGKLFSAYPGIKALQILAEENKKAGVAACLATIATQPLPVILECIKAIKEYWQQGGEGILGMHLEGPFINVQKRGAHLAEWIHEPTKNEVLQILDEGKDVIKIITVAPECCDPQIIRMFTDAGIHVSAGHTNATYEQARKFSSMGVSLVTHMFNAMSPLHHRDTGVPGASFEDLKLFASIIPDGIHVSFSALKIAKKQMGDRLFFITDSVTETSTGPYQHHLNKDHYCTADGTLSGSAISLLQGIKNAVAYAGISSEEAILMATLYPAKAIGIDNDYGSIAIGKKSSMLLLNEELEIVQNFI